MPTLKPCHQRHSNSKRPVSLRLASLSFKVLLASKNTFKVTMLALESQKPILCLFLLPSSQTPGNL